MFAGERCAEIVAEKTRPAASGCLWFRPKGRSFRSLRPQPGKEGRGLQGAFGRVLVLDVSEDISSRGLGSQLLFDLLQVSRGVVAFAQPVAAERGGDDVRCFELVAFGNTERSLMLAKQIENLTCEPRLMAELKGDTQRARPRRRGFLEEGREPGRVRFKVWRQLEENQAHASG